MDLHLYFFDEHKNNIVHRVVDCRETPTRYVPVRALPYIRMSYLPRENIGKVVGIYRKGVFFTRENEAGAKEAFADYFSEERKRLNDVICKKYEQMEKLKELICSFYKMEVFEK